MPGLFHVRWVNALEMVTYARAMGRLVKRPNTRVASPAMADVAVTRSRLTSVISLVFFLAK